MGSLKEAIALTNQYYKALSVSNDILMYTNKVITNHTRYKQQLKIILAKAPQKVGGHYKCIEIMLRLPCSKLGRVGTSPDTALHRAGPHSKLPL